MLGSYSVGTGPRDIAFDGANIWVANNGSNNVTELQASTGLVLGTFSVGAAPRGIAFDGVNIWVTNGFRKPFRSSKTRSTEASISTTCRASWASPMDGLADVARPRRLRLKPRNPTNRR